MTAIDMRDIVPQRAADAPPVGTWTRDPLPADVASVTVSWCLTCGASAFSYGGVGFEGQPYTRTEAIDPTAGTYLVQPHLTWCPVWTGVKPELPCPRCGAPVEGYKYENGFALAVPDPTAPGGVGHVLGTSDEVLNHPAARFSSAGPKPHRSFDKATLDPCGHQVQGTAAHDIRRLAAEIRRSQLQTEADAILAGVQALLAAATEAGHGPVVEAYRQAVRSRSRDVSGLLKALHLLHPDHVPQGDPA